MGPKMVMFIMFCFFWCGLVSLFIEGAWYGSTDIDLVDNLTGFSIMQIQDAGFWAIPKAGVGFFTHGLPKVLLWDYAFFTGDFQIIRWGMVIIFTTALIWAVSQSFLGAVQGIFRR